MSVSWNTFGGLEDRRLRMWNGGNIIPVRKNRNSSVYGTNNILTVGYLSLNCLRCCLSFTLRKSELSALSAPIASAFTSKWSDIWKTEDRSKIPGHQDCSTEPRVMSYEYSCLHSIAAISELAPQRCEGLQCNLRIFTLPQAPCQDISLMRVETFLWNGLTRSGHFQGWGVTSALALEILHKESLSAFDHSFDS